MADDLAAVRESICGSKVFGEYPRTDVDHVSGLVSLLARMKKAAKVVAPLTGTTEPPVKATPKTVLEELRCQTQERWRSREDGRWRSLDEAWRQVALDLAVLGDVVPTPAVQPEPKPPATAGWKPLPVPTAKLATSDRSSFENTSPTWGPTGMTILMPARGTDKTAVNPPDAGEGHQRCEITVAGQEGIGAGTRRAFRFVWELRAGFPTATDDWQVIAQWKGDGTGSPPLSLEVKDGSFYLTWHKLPTSPAGEVVVGPATAGVHDLVVDVTFGTTAAASPVSAWLDGVKRVSAVSPAPTLYSGKADRLKLGLYRDAGIGKAAGLVLRGFAAGSSVAAVTT